MEEVIFAVSSVIQFIGNHAFGINILLAITIVFFERRDPRTIWAWLLVLYFVPVLGFFLYLLIELLLPLIIILRLNLCSRC